MTHLKRQIEYKNEKIYTASPRFLKMKMGVTFVTEESQACRQVQVNVSSAFLQAFEAVGNNERTTR